MASSLTIAQNVDSVYPYVGRISWASADGDGGAAGPIKTANTAKDGTGIVNTIFTAASNGSVLFKIRFRSAGTNVDSVARIFINNGSTSSTASNNILYDEVSLAATTLTETAAQSNVEWGGSLMLPAGYKILVTIGTTVAAGWRVCGVGGDL